MRSDDTIGQPGPLSGKALSEAQLRGLLEYVADEACHAQRTGATRAITNELIVILLVNTGLRARELCDLSIRDLPMSPSGNTLLVRDRTGRVTRGIDLSNDITARLNKFVKLYRQGAVREAPLFASERGGRLSYASLYSKLRHIGRRTGITALHPHMLRHTCLARLYDLTQDLRLVQLRAGHAQPATTAMYAKGDAGNAAAEPIGEGSGGVRLEQPVPGEVEAVDAARSPHFVPAGGMEECGACGRTVSCGALTRIDSGQLLCPDCLRELRRR